MSNRSLTGRGFLGVAGAAGLASLTPRPRTASPPLFEAVPAAKSGIKFVHENAMSQEHYLQETVGPDCAFLDYDNDGWTNVYRINSSTDLPIDNYVTIVEGEGVQG